MVFHSNGCKNHNIEKFTTYFTTSWCSTLKVVKITTLKNSQHILQHGHVVKDQNSLHASFYDISFSSVFDVVKHIVISSFYNVVTVPTSLVLSILFCRVQEKLLSSLQMLCPCKFCSKNLREKIMPQE